MKLAKEIKVFGDSLMRGVVLDGQSKYCVSDQNAVTLFSKEFSCNIDNRSKFGFTIDKGYRTLSGLLAKGRCCDAALIEYGGNDCDFDWEKIASEPQGDHQPKTPLNEFIKTYREMIISLLKNNIRPVLMSLPPIDAQKYLGWITRNGLNRENIIKWLGDVQMIYRFQELYSAAVTRLAYEFGCLYVDVRSAFLDKHNYSDLLCLDGIHPSLEGQALMGKTFASFVLGNEDLRRTALV